MVRSYKTLWDAIEDNPVQPENMRLRYSLALVLKDHIADAGLTQAEAARIFGVTQPRISDLIRGHIDLFSIDSLVNMLAAAGLGVELHIARAA
jgi:predicted XRE-type DNA-binding protein